MLGLLHWFLHGDDVGKRLTIALGVLSSSLGAVYSQTGKLPDRAGWLLVSLAAAVAFGSRPNGNGSSEGK